MSVYSNPARSVGKETISIQRQLIMNKHAHDSANGVCKAHVLTMPAKDSNSAPPTSNWTRRELFPAEGGGTIGN